MFFLIRMIVFFLYFGEPIKITGELSAQFIIVIPLGFLIGYLLARRNINPLDLVEI